MLMNRRSFLETLACAAAATGVAAFVAAVVSIVKAHRKSKAETKED